MFYGEKIKDLRERIGLTQVQIAKILKINNKTYSHYENEDTNIPLKHLITICNYFNVSLDYIFNFTDIKQYKNINYNPKLNNGGIRLKEFRKENKITQVKLADILNTTHSVIADYERNRYMISTPFLYTICKKYNISADYLLGRIDNPKYINKNNN